MDIDDFLNEYGHEQLIHFVNDNLKISDEVTIWGGDCLDSRLENVSNKHNLLPYVYLTNLSQRVQRIYV